MPKVVKKFSKKRKRLVLRSSSFQTPSFLILILIVAGTLLFWLLRFGNTNNIQGQNMIVNANSWKLYESKDEGFSFTYPANWQIGVADNTIHVANNQKYIDFFANGDNSVTLPQTGIKAQWQVKKNIVPAGTPLQRLVKNGVAPANLPIIDDQYLTVNGISAYREVVQSIKNPSEGPSDIKRTDVDYFLLKDSTVYRFNCEIDNNNPQNLITTCDSIAKSFSFVK